MTGDMFPDERIIPERQEKRDPLDRYYTPSLATHALIEFLGTDLRGRVWEPACGAGNIVDLLVPRGLDVRATDLDPSARSDEPPLDFLGPEAALVDDVNWVVTNPPYASDFGTATQFVERALDVAIDGVAMLLRISWLEPCRDRAHIFRRDPPTDVLVLERVHYIGAPESNQATSAWFVWNGQARGATRLHWWKA